jgi:hypothetical protein
MEKDNLIEEYKFKVLRMEKQSFQLQEICDELKKMHRDDIRKLGERNRAIEKRCEELDSRRRLDNAGFREDIKGLKSLLNSLERKFKLCEKRCGGISVQAGSKTTAQRAVTAPGNFAGGPKKTETGEDQAGQTGQTESEVKEVLTWEALNCLLAIAGRKVCELERRVKQGCPSDKF